MNGDRKSRRTMTGCFVALAMALASVACAPIEPIDYAFDPNAATPPSSGAEAAPAPETPAPSAAPDAGSAAEQAVPSRSTNASAAALAEGAALFEGRSSL